MIGANTTIVTYRLATASSKDTYSASPTLNGVPVFLGQENMERAMMIDQENAHLVHRMESDEDLDIRESDKVTDAGGNTYVVHSVQKGNRSLEIGNNTVCVLRRKR